MKFFLKTPHNPPCKSCKQLSSPNKLDWFSFLILWNNLALLVFWYCGFLFLIIFFPEIYLSLLLSALCMILQLQHFIIPKDLFLQLWNVNMGWTHAYKKIVLLPVKQPPTYFYVYQVSFCPCFFAFSSWLALNSFSSGSIFWLLM